MKKPNNISELTNENDGRTYFKCNLEVSEVNFALNGYENEGEMRILESHNPYSFSWQILRTETLNEISFGFKFKNPSLISKYAKDKMIIELLKPEQFSALDNNQLHV